LRARPVDPSDANDEFNAYLYDKYIVGDHQQYSHG